jgi:hypothetical protein
VRKAGQGATIAILQGSISLLGCRRASLARRRRRHQRAALSIEAGASWAKDACRSS